MTQGIFDWSWVVDNLGDIWGALAEHIVLTAIPVGLGFLMAFPMALASIRWPRLYSPLLGVAGILFAIPTLALFVVMIPFTGLSKATAIIPLTLYTLLILLRNTVEGLKGVPSHVTEAAEAMGYTRAPALPHRAAPCGARHNGRASHRDGQHHRVRGDHRPDRAGRAR